MVSRVFIVLILLLGQVRSMAQIDKLTTPSDVLQFVRGITHDYGFISDKMGFHYIRQVSFDSLAALYHLHSFEKEDLDGNGLTDLVFNGSEYGYSGSDSIPYPVSFAILSFGKDSFEVRNLKLGVFGDVAARTLRLNGKQYIQIIRMTGSRHGLEYHADTLEWRCNAFIEKRSQVKRRISQIDYTSWNGLAFWQNITLRVTGDSVRLTKARYQDANGQQDGGVFLTRLEHRISQRLYGLLEAIDFVRLKDSFYIRATDATTGAIRISYDDGRTKTITDYGTCGTYGLAELHQLLYGLTETQHWINADPVSPRCIDSLHSDAEVLGLIRTLDTDYPFLEFEPEGPIQVLPDYRERLAAFGQQRWQKADIDGNGYIDLLFNGYLNKDGESHQCSIVVLSYGGDSLRLQEITGGHDFFSARIFRSTGHENVAIRTVDTTRDSTMKKGYRLIAKQDTLTAYDGYMVELPAPALHAIEAIHVREDIGGDSLVVTPELICWYKNDADYSHLGEPGAVTPKDSINLYTLADPNAAQHLFPIAAGIRLERINPALPLNNVSQYHGSTWYVNYDGGKRSQFKTYGPIGSYRPFALEVRLWELKHYRTDWKFISHIKSNT